MDWEPNSTKVLMLSLVETQIYHVLYFGWGWINFQEVFFAEET